MAGTKVKYRKTSKGKLVSQKGLMDRVALVENLCSAPKVAKVEIAQVGRVRRAKLYYLRGLEGKAARVEREVET